MDTVQQLKPAGPKTKFKFKAAPIENYDARALYAMKFQDTAHVITRMDTMQKALISSEVQVHLDCLYEQANRFGNPDFGLDEQPSAAQFRGIMGKIKHWETILYWLFEIDVMMEAEDLQRLAVEAEKEIEHYQYALDMKGVNEQYKALSHKMIAKNTKIIDKANNTIPRTQEIIDMAASLATKYFR